MKKKSLQQPTSHIPTSPLVTEVLGRIETEKIKPKAWWQFVCMNCLVWTAWALTVFVGAISVSVLMYVNYRSSFELFEATHDSYIAFLLEALPFVWIFTFVIMLLLAYLNIRLTKCGYRYPLWKMLGSSMFVSVSVGILLHMLGFGYVIDTQFGKMMPIYTSLERMERDLWQVPQEGRLIGRVQSIDYDTNTYTLLDINKQTWTILMTELDGRDISLLQSGSEVRIIGTTTNFTEGIFYACGVFPWKFEEAMNADYLRSERKAFENRMYAHMNKKSVKIQRKHNNTANTVPSDVCANLTTVRRMKK